MTENDLVGTWTVTAAGGVPTPAGVESHLTFGDDGRMHGRGGVNNIGGDFHVEPGDPATLVIGPCMSTLMAGPDDAMAHEYRVTSNLEGRLRLVIDGDRASLGDGVIELEWVKP
ncbi:MAG: META domain-containing protein [Microthrixaceae bacterium]|jgi:heat shock protein HslJ|nr:META domain-containing protein [Microthrixaceae bacterium]